MRRGNTFGNEHPGRPDRRSLWPGGTLTVRPRGFTLVEMLVVVGVIIIVLLLVKPALTSLNQSNTFNAGVAQMNTLLEEAHTAALANNTYVWVGFIQLPANGGVGMAFVDTPSGNPADIFNANNTPSILKSLNKPVVLQGLSLTKITTRISDPNRMTVSVGQLNDNANSLQTTDAQGEAVRAQFTASIAGTSQNFVSGSKQPCLTAILEITPSGHLLISPTKYACIEVGLAPVYGDAQNVAVLQLNTSTGRVTEFRP